MKCCSVCKKELELSEFHKNKSARDGLTTACKECAKARARDWSANTGRLLRHAQTADEERAA